MVSCSLTGKLTQYPKFVSRKSAFMCNIDGVTQTNADNTLSTKISWKNLIVKTLIPNVITECKWHVMWVA